MSEEKNTNQEEKNIKDESLENNDDSNNESIENNETKDESQDAVVNEVVENTPADNQEVDLAEAENKDEENTDDVEVKVEEISREDWKKRIKPGMTIRVHQKIREMNTKGEIKERIQIFEGIVLAHKHGQETGATIMVRKVSNGVGVEKIFPINSPNVEKVELLKKAKVNRAKLFFLRFRRKKKKRLKEKKID